VGTLRYDGMTVDFDDRLLAHIELVVVQKLRRQETFLLTWQNAEQLGGGRTGIWLHSSALLTFHFEANENPHIDRAWLEKLMSSANSSMGMFVTDAAGVAAHPSDLDPHS
jgi:hypothetical protein